MALRIKRFGHEGLFLGRAGVDAVAAALAVHGRHSNAEIKVLGTKGGFRRYVGFFHFFLREEYRSDGRVRTDGRALVALDAVKKGLDIISGDLAKLARRVIEEAGVTGIYLSLQNLQGVSRETYDAILAPGEKAILEAANAVSDYQILHICGYAGHRNDLSWYTDYPAKAINWAAVVEGVPLEEGKRLFGGKAVIGGFGNLDNEILYTGTKEEIQAETKRLLAAAGRTGVILGADCTVPRDTDWKHFEWVREAAK